MKLKVFYPINGSMKKLVIYSFILVILFFVSLEGIQRVRYFLKQHSSYWLFYGFVKQPDNYKSMLEKDVYKKILGVDIIETPTLFYKGYRKLNPDFKTSNWYKVNSHGLRGKEFSLNKNPDLYRIVTLGGSTTFGACARDGFTYSDFLEDSLNSKPGKKYEVINAGISGADLEEIKNLFKYDIVDLKPDMVIINSVFNNLYNSKSVYKCRTNSVQKINQILIHKSLFYVTLREKIQLVTEHNGWLPDICIAPLQDIVNNFMEDDVFWKNLKNIYIDIIETAEADGIKIIIVKEPVWLRDYKKDRCGMLLDRKLKPVYEKAYDLLDDIAEEKDIDVVNVNSYFESLTEKKEFFADGLHLTEKGNEYMAEIIYKRFFDKGAGN